MRLVVLLLISFALGTKVSAQQYRIHQCGLAVTSIPASKVDSMQFLVSTKHGEDTLYCDLNNYSKDAVHLTRFGSLLYPLYVETKIKGQWQYFKGTYDPYSSPYSSLDTDSLTLGSMYRASWKVRSLYSPGIYRLKIRFKLATADSDTIYSNEVNVRVSYKQLRYLRRSKKRDEKIAQHKNRKYYDIRIDKLKPGKISVEDITAGVVNGTYRKGRLHKKQQMRIIKFMIVIAPKDGMVEIWPVTGSNIPKEVMEHLKELNHGDMIFLSDVTCMLNGSYMFPLYPTYTVK